MGESYGRRRSLTHVGGPIFTVGAAEEAGRLADSLRVSPPAADGDDPARAHVHGFHSHPARMHPVTAARLIAGFSSPGDRILDPFCGSGTVLVEGLRLGRRVIGTDLNPLAVRLTYCKTRPRNARELTNLVTLARRCGQQAEARRLARCGPSRRFPESDLRLFEPHVLLELDSLRCAIEELGEESARLDLGLVLSALLVKLSRRESDTSARLRPRQTAAGHAIRLFVSKTEEFAERLRAFWRLLPTECPQVQVAVDDATRLTSVEPGSVDAIITSPPYAATYDYLAHHELRLRWLGLETEAFRHGELGSRAAYRRLEPRRAASRWQAELGRFLRAAHRVLRPDGVLVMLIGDSSIGDQAIRADAVVAAAATAGGFTVLARASQPRPHFHAPGQAAFRSRPRAEHAICLRKS